MSYALQNAAMTLTSEAEAVLGSLCDLLDRESDAVRSADFEAFRNIQNDKHTMLTRYKSLLETMNNQAPALKSAGEVVAKRLESISSRFQKTTQRNTEALESGMSSITRVTNRIVRTARDTVHANRQTYTSRGQSSLNGRTPVSLKVDEVL